MNWFYLTDFIEVSVAAAGSSLSPNLFSLGVLLLCVTRCTEKHYGSVFKAQWAQFYNSLGELQYYS